MTARTRVLRTIAQVLVAVAVATPTAVATLGLPAAVAGKVVGVAGAAVVIITAIQNALEHKAGRAIGEPPPT